MSEADRKMLLNAFEAGGCGLRVEFWRRADRFQHCIGWWTPGEFEPLLESIEGDASEPWPPSPPWQQLHFEQRGERGSVALLVGMAGRSHWSLSIEPDRATSALLFDAACRVSGPAAQLGSRYRLLSASSTSDGNAIALRSTSAKASILLEAATGTLALDEARLEIDLRPIVSGPTARWKYRVLVDPTNGESL